MQQLRLSRFFMRILLLIFGIFSIFSLYSIQTYGQNAIENIKENIGPSGLPLPRFVSIKSARVNMRVGPGHNYSVIFTYQKQGLPVEITQEYDQWRKIRDSDGDEGWIYQSLLSGKRTALIAPWEKNKKGLTFLRQKPDENSTITAKVEPGVIGNIRECNGHWCEVEIQNVQGWLKQTEIWGAYPNERVNN